MTAHKGRVRKVKRGCSWCAAVMQTVPDQRLAVLRCVPLTGQLFAPLTEHLPTSFSFNEWLNASNWATSEPLTSPWALASCHKHMTGSTCAPEHTPPAIKKRGLQKNRENGEWSQRPCLDVVLKSVLGHPSTRLRCEHAQDTWRLYFTPQLEVAWDEFESIPLVVRTHSPFWVRLDHLLSRVLLHMQSCASLTKKS